MGKRNLLLSATLLVSLPLVAVAQGPDRARDEAAIRQVVQYYFDAMKNDDVESLKKAFHPKAKWLNAGDKGYLWEIPRNESPTISRAMRAATCQN